MTPGPDTARQLARLSEIVYRPWTEVDRAMDALGYGLKATWDHRGTQGMLVYSTAWAAVVFRGTEAGRGDLRDIFANLTWPWPLPWMGAGRIHSGYKDAFAMVACDALEMAKAVVPELPLYVTGHSMGGALATLFASYYAVAHPNWKLASLVNFGTPKAVSRAAADAISCPIARYVIPWDFAPSWPPVLGLVHPAAAVRLEWNGGGNPVSRHNVENYVAALTP